MTFCYFSLKFHALSLLSSFDFAFHVLLRDIQASNHLCSFSIVRTFVFEFLTDNSRWAAEDGQKDG